MSVTALKPADLPDHDNLDDLTRLCKALADDLRLTILRLLKNESFGVLEICRVLDIRQSALSHHLKILSTAGLVSTRREGNSIFYRRALIPAGDPFAGFRQSALTNIDRLPLTADAVGRVALIHRERSQQSLDFFRRNAAKFKEHQGLIAEYRQYAGNLEDLIAGLRFESEPVIMEVGPGEGELLLHLARNFDRVVAMDNSVEMLEQARLTVQNQSIDNVEFIHGDITEAPAHSPRCDLIVLNMVLHHIPAPVEVFHQAGRLLKHGGALLLVELISHDQDWVRESCGDLWLGFDSNDLSNWATDARLAEGQSLYLGLRNGFQIQVRLFSSETNNESRQPGAD